MPLPVNRPPLVIKPPPTSPMCPINDPKLGACVDALGGLVHIGSKITICKEEKEKMEGSCLDSTKVQRFINIIGNPHINAKTEERGVYEGHMLITNQTYQGLIKNCIDSNTLDCVVFQNKANQERGPVNIYNIYDEICPSNKSEQVDVGGRDPCEGDYVTRYLNTPEVQKSLHANMTGLPYAWGLCSLANEHWKDAPAMVPVYKRLLEAKLPILLYSGDVDGAVPVTSTYNSINKMDLTMVGWRPWFDDRKKLAGHRVD